MPRGYLKHCKTVSRRAARGSSSKNGRSSSAKKSRSYQRPIDLSHDDFDLSVYEPSTWSDWNREEKAIDCVTHQAEVPVEVCPVCFETGTVVKLMKKCSHPAACHQCLREMYVCQAQKDVSNYPLHCFDPSCRRIVVASQLRSLNLVNCEAEMTRHFRLTELRKAYDERVRLVHCPRCDHPRRFSAKKTEADRIFSCKQCSSPFVVLGDRLRTIRAIEAFEKDKFGVNDGWAHCPGCNLTISKGDGCPFMTCPCGTSFMWTDMIASKQKEKNMNYREAAVTAAPSASS